MNLFDNIVQLISSLPYDMSSVKAWYDGTITFKMSEFLGDVVLDVVCSEMRLSLCIDEDTFKDRFINVTNEGLIYLTNELNTNVDTVSFSALSEDNSPCLCLKKSFNYATRDEAIRFLIQGLTLLKRIVEATLSVAYSFFDDKYIPDFYELITTEINKTTFDSIVQTLPPLNILIVDDLFSKKLTSVKLQLMTRLSKCKIYEAKKELNPYAMLNSLEYEIRKHNIDVVIAYGSGCFFAHQLNGVHVHKILLNPKFYISEELQMHEAVINADSSDLPYDIDTYRHFTIETCQQMEDRQFMNISSDNIDNTVGYFDLDKCSSKNGEIFNSVYGPINTLSENWLEDDGFTRFELIPTIERLYYKSNCQPFSSNITRAEFAECLRTVVNDHIAYPRPCAYNECAYIHVSPYTHDIIVESGYRAALLERMNRDGDIVPNEDVINFFTLQRFPDKRVSDFIERILMVTDPYRLNQSNKLTDILLAIDKTDLSMTVRIKDNAITMCRSKNEDIYPLSRFVKRYARHKIAEVSMVNLTAIALKYIPVEDL